MDIFSIFNIFITPEAGLIIMAVMSLMEFIIKPIIKKFGNGHRNKKTNQKDTITNFSNSDVYRRIFYYLPTSCYYWNWN